MLGDSLSGAQPSPSGKTERPVLRIREEEDESKESTSNQRQTKLLADAVASLNRPVQLEAISVSLTDIDLVLGVKPSQKGQEDNVKISSSCL